MTLTQKPRAATFILSEAEISRQNGIVKAGENLAAGEVLMFDGNELITFVSGAAAGILVNAVDATDAAVPCIYIARKAEVNAMLLTHPEAEQAVVVEALSEIGIIARGAATISEGGGVDYVGPLDIVSGATVAFGQRALSAARLNQPLYTIREDAGDTTQAFNADAVTGAAPVATINTFLDGADGYVATWNDQSGDGKNASQATVGKQPQWEASQFGDVPALVFSFANQSILATASVSTFSGGGVTIFAVAQLDSDEAEPQGTLVGQNYNLQDGNGANLGCYISGAFPPDSASLRIEANDADYVCGVGGYSATNLSLNGIHLLIEVGAEFGSTILMYNGISVPVGVDRSFDGPPMGPVEWPLAIGNREVGTPHAGQYWNGPIAEVIIYPTLLSSGDRALIRENIAAYYGITLP